MLNKAQIVALLSRNPLAVGKAMVILLSLQTPTEQSTGATFESNGRGFSGHNSSHGTYYAHWVLRLTTLPYSAWCVRYKPTPSQVSRAIAHFLTGDNYKRGRPLTGPHYDRALGIASFHWGQLAAEAECKARANEWSELSENYRDPMGDTHMVRGGRCIPLVSRLASYDVGGPQGMCGALLRHDRFLFT